jgi:delta14-sterol reductase
VLAGPAWGVDLVMRLSSLDNIARRFLSLLTPVLSRHFLQFGGHLATPILVFLTPLTVYGLYYGCSSPSGCPAPLSHWAPNFLSFDWLQGFLDPTAFAIYLGWYAFCVAAWKFIPGEWVDGTLMRDGQRKSYKINGQPTAQPPLPISLIPRRSLS